MTLSFRVRPALHAIAFIAIPTIAMLPAAAAAQQELTVSGRVIGADTMPMAGQPVMLHRVDAAGGATIAEDVTAADGTFRMGAPASADAEAVYFVASRLDGELYIGPPFRATDESAANQLLQVGVPAMSATALLEGQQAPVVGAPMRRPATPSNWLLLIVPLVGVAAAALWMLIPRGTIPEQRQLLIRVAELDERLAAAPPGQRETLRAERDQLMARLRTV
jgi:hypothetical protein